jgi:hypothetical protein
MAEQLVLWGADPRLSKLVGVSYQTLLRELRKKKRLSENDLLKLCEDAGKQMTNWFAEG